MSTESVGQFSQVSQGGQVVARRGTFDPREHLIRIQRNGPANYLPVAWRLVWLRTEHPDASIVTEMVKMNENGALFKAEITLRDGTRVVSYGSETKGDFRDFIEKAETKAIGRALLLLGYGLEHAAEDIDDGSGRRGNDRSSDEEDRDFRRR